MDPNGKSNRPSAGTRMDISRRGFLAAAGAGAVHIGSLPHVRVYWPRPRSESRSIEEAQRHCDLSVPTEEHFRRAHKSRSVRRSTSSSSAATSSNWVAVGRPRIAPPTRSSSPACSTLPHCLSTGGRTSARKAGRRMSAPTRSSAGARPTTSLRRVIHWPGTTSILRG
jgi:hypothetical protein